MTKLQKWGVALAIALFGGIGVAAIPAGYNFLNGTGWFAADGSGPYVVDAAGNAKQLSVSQAEDAAAADGDAGSFVLGVRRDTAGAATTSAASDYSQFSVNRWGAAWVVPWQHYARTYSASANFAPAATATDVAQICGVIAGPVQLISMTISGTQTTAGMFDMLLIKRSTATSGGTSSAPTVVPVDNGDGAGSAALLTFTANPTPGSTVGTIHRAFVPIGTATSLVIPYTINFGVNAKPVMLNGTGQCVDLNFNSVTMAGGSVTVSWTWVEAP
jgi:hypothetical protein